MLLENLEGLDWVELTRTDECCGFGGTFAVTEEALSIQMGKDRLADHLSQKTEILTGGDMSCIMHLQGIATRSKQELKFLHLAEILNQALS
jgi:L-lactate dehydrogenase complex protein LldE